MTRRLLLLLLLVARAFDSSPVIVSAATRKKRLNVIHVMGDDVGYDNIGLFNNGTTFTPSLNALLGKEGVRLSQYYTFKICGPSRASTMTGRYPFNVGFYADGDAQHITNFTTTAELMKEMGYATRAIGKWDVGYVVKETTATYKGFDTWMGYYKACNDDLFYHSTNDCDEDETKDVQPTDLSRNVGESIMPKRDANGTYSTRLFTQEAVHILNDHFAEPNPSPMYLYVAPQNVHLACGTKASKIVQGIQAPCRTVSMYKRVKNDTFKGQSAVTTELDFLVGNITETLKSLGVWNDTIVVFTSDNGGPLDHTTNFPFRGGKHTFWEGGIRVIAGIGGGAIPPERRGRVWDGLVHSSDWYRTVVVGVAGGDSFERNATGPHNDDSFNVWNALLSGEESPRKEIIHQVSNRHFTEHVTSIRMGDYKLIVGNPGDARMLRWPKWGSQDTAFGETGGSTRDNGCLFNLRDDPSETRNLYGKSEHVDLINALVAKLRAAGDNAPPPSSYWQNNTWGLSRICDAQRHTGFLEPL